MLFTMKVATKSPNIHFPPKNPSPTHLLSSQFTYFLRMSDGLYGTPKQFSKPFEPLKQNFSWLDVWLKSAKYLIIYCLNNVMNDINSLTTADFVRI